VLQEMKKMEEIGTVTFPMVLCCRFAVLECYSTKLFYFRDSFLKESGLSIDNLMKMANECGEMLSSPHSEKRYVLDFWHQKYSACLYAKYAILYFYMGDRTAALASIQHFIRGYSYFDRSPGNLFHAQIPILISICDNLGDDLSIKVLRTICTNSESLNWVHMAAEQTGFNPRIYSMEKDQRKLNSVKMSNEEYVPPEPPQKVVKRASYQKPTPTLPPINTFTEQRLDPILPAWKSPKSYSSTQDQLSFMTDDFSLPSLQKLPDIHFLHEELKHQQNTNWDLPDNIPTLPILPTPKRLSRTSYDNHSLPSTFIPNSNPNHLRETLPPLSNIVFISQPSIDTNYIYMISKLDQANPKIVRIDTEEDN